MPEHKRKIVLDSDLLISLLLSDDLSKLNPLLSSKRVKLIFCDELLHEVLQVAESRQFKKYFDFEDAFRLWASIIHQTKSVKLKSDVKRCKDPKDDYLLALCVDGKAHYFITENKEFLALKKIGETQILSVSEYLNLA